MPPSLLPRLIVGALTALLASATIGPTLPWSLAQLVKALWPLSSPLADRVQQRAWHAWEAEVKDRVVPAESIEEVSIDSTPSLKNPFIIRGLLNGSSSMLAGDLEWLTRAPVGDLEVDYFSNASVEEGVVPNARGPLRDVVRRIASGGPEKIGTEMIFRKFPSLLAELMGDSADHVARILGGASHVAESRVGTLLTVPVFMATGAERARTDLHSEPIGNLVLMLAGRKKWTLIDPDQSRYLRPTLSPDGRAYFLSSTPTEDPDHVLRHVRRRVFDAEHGDAIWVPTWTWHRVDYYPGVTALSASLFHVRADQMVQQNGLYSLLAMPNMVKELIGWKTQ